MRCSTSASGKRPPHGRGLRAAARLLSSAPRGREIRASTPEYPGEWKYAGREAARSRGTRRLDRPGRGAFVYIVLTDHLRCPRCGPEHGLVLLGERIEARRVLEGVLGCANCRERYPVRGGSADLRGAGDRSPAPPPGQREGAALPSGSHHPGGGEGTAGGTEGGGQAANAQTSVLRLAAQLGVKEGPAFVLVAGVAAELATGVAGLVPGIEVVAVGAELAERDEVPGVSRLAVGHVLPLAAGGRPRRWRWRGTAGASRWRRRRGWWGRTAGWCCGARRQRRWSGWAVRASRCWPGRRGEGVVAVQR